MNVTSRHTCSVIVTAMIALYAAAKLRLYTTPMPLVQDTPLADFTASEATFTGYPVGGIAYTATNPPFNDPAGGIVFAMPTQTFVATDDVSPNTIAGWFITDASGLLLLSFGAFNAPIPMQQAGDGLPFSVGLTFGQAEGIIVNTNYAE